MITGLYGTLTIGADGTYSYVLNDANPAVQGLDTGDTPITDIVHLHGVGRHGDVDTATLTVSVFGTNDAPVAIADTNWAQEDTLSTPRQRAADAGASWRSVGLFRSATMADTDVDVETLTVSSVGWNGPGGDGGHHVCHRHGDHRLTAR